MKKKICSKCSAPRRQFLVTKGTKKAGVDLRYCLKHHAEYMRNWRKTHKLSPEARKRMNARAYANVYLKRGKIERKPCYIDGCQEKPQMHHPDHSKPLEVVWACRKHHMQIHHS